MSEHTPEEIARAKSIAEMIDRKASALLEPMVVEMQFFADQWRPEFRAIMWEAIGYKALEKAKEAHKG